MKNQPDDSLLNLMLLAGYTKKKTQNESHLKLAPIPLGDVLTTEYKEGEPKNKLARRALELSRKGIFACPKFTQFFNDYEEDRRIR